MAPEIAKLIDRAVESDLRLVRKEGEIIISETKMGNLFLGYDSITREYVLRASVSPGLPCSEIARGAKSLIKAKIAECYVIEVAAAV